LGWNLQDLRDIMPPYNISILILAAGASTRMRGADKLLEPVAGQPLLRHVAGVALGCGLPVLVAVSRANTARRAALMGLNVDLRTVTATDGMAASLREGVAALPASHAVLVLLADMPEVDSADLARMIASYVAAPDMIHRAHDPKGRPGHPVVFPAWLRPALLALRGDAGAKTLIKTHAAHLRPVTLPAGHATTDLDTPEAWVDWRKRQGLVD
jgi:molybdenum cofactor cytidylyltransferase